MRRPSDYDQHDQELIARARQMIWEDIENEDLESQCHSSEARAEISRIKMRQYHHEMRVFDD